MKLSARIPQALLPALLLLGMSGGGAYGAGIKIEPGLWRVTTVIKTAMIEKETRNQELQCLRKNPFTPEKRGAKHKSCKIDKTQKADNEVTWEMVCQSKLGKVVESGRFKLGDDRGRGVATSTLKVGEQTLVTEIVWKGRRLGKCDMDVSKLPKKIIGNPAAEALPKLPSAASGD